MKNLKALRLSKKLSQQQLALRLDLSQQTIYKYENGIKLANYFNTSVDYLIGNTNNPQRPGSYSETELTESELQHLRIYRNMPNTVQELLDSFLSEVFKGTI